MRVEFRTRGLEEQRQKWSRYVNLLGRRGMENIMNDVGNKWVKMVKKRFDQGRDVKGQYMKRNAPSVVEQKGFNKPMVRSGKLRSGIRYWLRKSGNKYIITLGSHNRGYLEDMVAIHHAPNKTYMVRPRSARALAWSQGGRMMFSKGHKVRHWKREFWGLSRAMSNEAEKMVTQAVYRIHRKAGL